MAQGNLTIIRGLPGAGKSTMARALMAEGAAHFEADMFFMDAGVYRFDATRIKDAHAWCQSQVRQALASGRDVIVSNTFVKKWEMKAYLDMAPNAMVLIATGNYGNVHGVPAEVVERMRANWEA